MSGASTTAEALEAGILAATGPPGPRPPSLPPPLEARRRGLLAELLGYVPATLPPPLHVLGDSHVAFFAGAEKLEFHKGRRVLTGLLRARTVSAFTELLPVFRVFHLGPATAWNAFERGSSTRAREKIDALVRHGDLPPGAALLLVFGEIDIRCHLPKAVLAGRPLAEAVAATVDRFMRLPLQLLRLGYRPAVWLPSVTPVQPPDADDTEGRVIPFVGSQALRDEVRDAYGRALAEACARHGLPAVALRPPPELPVEKRFLDIHHLSQRLMPAALEALVAAGVLDLPRGPGPAVAPPTGTAWDGIDAIPVVNLDQRRDRWDRLRAAGEGILPPGKLLRIPAVVGRELPGYGSPPWFRGRPGDSRWAARAGCVLSHRRILELAKANGWDTVLVLEDDADWSRLDGTELLEILARLLAVRAAWDVCYLGYSKASGPARVLESCCGRDLCRVSGCATTHAYLVNAAARDRILARLPAPSRIWPWIARHRAIDRWYARHLSRWLKVLAVSPALIPQAEGFSDIVQQRVDYEADFPGAVLRPARHDAGFRLARLGWRVAVACGGLFDLLRALGKRRRGF